MTHEGATGACLEWKVTARVAAVWSAAFVVAAPPWSWDRGIPVPVLKARQATHCTSSTAF